MSYFFSSTLNPPWRSRKRGTSVMHAGHRQESEAHTSGIRGGVHAGTQGRANEWIGKGSQRHDAEARCGVLGLRSCGDEMADQASAPQRQSPSWWARSGPQLPPPPWVRESISRGGTGAGLRAGCADESEWTGDSDRYRMLGLSSAEDDAGRWRPRLCACGRARRSRLQSLQALRFFTP